MIVIVEACVLLNNMIAHTQMNGDFRDEGGRMDLIT